MNTQTPVTGTLGLSRDMTSQWIHTAKSARLGKIMSSGSRTLILPISVCKEAQIVSRHVDKNHPANICRVGVATSHGQNWAWAMLGNKSIMIPNTPTTTVWIRKNQRAVFQGWALDSLSWGFRGQPYRYKM